MSRGSAAADLLDQRVDGGDAELEQGQLDARDRDVEVVEQGFLVDADEVQVLREREMRFSRTARDRADHLVDAGHDARGRS